MTQISSTKIAIAIATFAGTALLSFGWSEQRGVSLSVEEAQARVGRPLTPVSVAGVARRQNRRAAYGYGVGAGLAGAAAVGTAAAVAATSPTWGSPYYSTGWGNAYAAAPAYYGAYAAQNDPDFGKPDYAIRAYYGGAPYYGYTGWADYSGRNFLQCTPGTLTKLDDGNMYLCQ
jgi:drug/metabolite transporter (DMT)-like permease